MKNPVWMRALMRWGPAAAIMLVIFLLSNTPSDELVHFGVYDFVVKKGAHMVGYALLALALFRGFGPNRQRTTWLVMLLVLLYAISDEIHQSFVPGRTPAVMDVLIDMIGAGLAMFAVRLKKVRQIVLIGVDTP